MPRRKKGVMELSVWLNFNHAVDPEHVLVRARHLASGTFDADVRFYSRAAATDAAPPSAQAP